MKPRLEFLPLLLSLLAATALGAAEKSPLPNISGPVKGFTVPAQDFLLKGESALTQPDGRWTLTGIFVETRRGSNQINLILHSPVGVYDRAAGLVTSDGALEVRSRDDRFQLRGEGYEYRPGTNRLLIRSNVFTRFDRSFFETETGGLGRPRAAAADAGPLTVTASSLEFTGSTGDLFYRQAVKLTDGASLEVTAGEFALNVAALTNATRRAVAREDVQLRLQVERGTGMARGDEAVFSTEPGLDARVEMTGRAAWNLEPISGSAGRLRWQMISNRYEFTGEQGARLRFPTTDFRTNSLPVAPAAGGQLQWIDITSERHRFVPGELLFEGLVKARQDTNWSLGTDRLEIELDATNHPTRMAAIGSFDFEVHQAGREGRATAGQAHVVNPAQGPQVVTLTDSPRWVSPEFEKEADRIEVVDPLGEPAYSGDGHVRLKLAGLRMADFDWFGSRTNAAPSRPADVNAPTNALPVLVTAERSRYERGTAVFSGNVVVEQGTNLLRAAELTLKFTRELRLTNLLATGGVNVRQGQIVMTARELRADFEGTERNFPRVVASGDVRICGGVDQGRGRGLGERLTYDGVTGEAVLEGEPEVVVFGVASPDPKKQRPPVLTKATQLRWNLRDETVRTRGEYSIVTLPADAEFPRECD